MSTENPAPAVQVATPVVQEPSVPSTEVNPTDEPAKAESPELSEADKAKIAFEKRIARQTAANRDQQRQLQEEKRLREAAEKRIADYEAKSNPLADKPKPEDFESQEEYTDKLADWKLAQKEKEREQKTKEPNIDQIVEQKLKVKETELKFRTKEQAFSAKTPEYEKSAQVVNGLLKHVDPNHPSTQAFSSVLMNAPNPPELIHYLGTHPDVAIGLMNMSPFEIQDQLGVIIDQLSDAPMPVANGGDEPIPEALPAPPSPLKGSAKAPKSPDKMSGKELLERMEQLRRRR